MIHPSGYFGTPDMVSASGLDLERLPSSNPDGDFVLWLGAAGDRKVVFKSLAPKNFGNPLFVSLLRREYDIGRSLNHPGICETLAWQDREDIGPCIMMEYIDGCTLEEAISNRLFDRGTMRKILCDTCDAVSYLHHKQVIHRDLKPSNIMITKMGRNVKVLDFGLADTDSNLSGKIPAGTRLYAAPEVIFGEHADFRSDIYSIGKIIDECNIGLSRIAKKCTMADKSKRFASVGEIKEALQKKKSPKTFIVLLAIAVAAVVARILIFGPAKQDAASDIFLDLIDLTRKAATPS